MTKNQVAARELEAAIKYGASNIDVSVDMDGITPDGKIMIAVAIETADARHRDIMKAVRYVIAESYPEADRPYKIFLQPDFRFYFFEVTAV